MHHTTAFEMVMKRGPLPVALLDVVASLRVKAWASDGIQVGRDGRLTDNLDDDAFHSLVFRSDGVLVAAARLSLHGRDDLPDGFAPEDLGSPRVERVGALGRLVVAKEARGQGVSQQLDLERIALARGSECDVVLGVTSNAGRRNSLRQQGFVVTRETLGPVSQLPAFVLRLDLR